MSIETMEAGMAAGRKMAAADDTVAVRLRKQDPTDHFNNLLDLNMAHNSGEVLTAEMQEVLQFFNKFWQSRPGWPADDTDEQEIFVEAFFTGLKEGAPEVH